MTLFQYIGSWITTFRLARKYGIAGATDLCKKEMFLKKKRYFETMGHKWEDRNKPFKARP